MVGAHFQEGLRATSNSESRPGMAATHVAFDEVTPRLMPIGIGEASQIARNRDWRGAPIVPHREERELAAFEQFRQYQLPYVLEQMTGGLASGRVLRLPTEALQSSRSEPSLPVSEYFDMLTNLAAERSQANRRLRQFDREREYQVLHAFESQMRNLSAQARGEVRGGGRTVQREKPSDEELRAIRQQQVELARRALQMIR
jgi:hypothetical protein